MQNGVALARKQSGHADSCLLREFFEAAAEQLMCDEDLSLVLR
jgi:hypothetical protein